MKFRRNVTIEIVLCVLLFCFISLTAAMFFVNRNLFFVVLGMTVFIVVLFGARVVQIRKGLATIITGIGPGMKETQQTMLSSISTPVVVTNRDGAILWYNDSMRADVLSGKDAYLDGIDTVLPDFDMRRCCENGGSVCSSPAGKHYRVFTTKSSPDTDEELYITLLIDDTEQHTEAENFHKARPSVLMFSVDSYDEMIGETKESVRAEMMSEVYRAMENFINSTNGIFFRLSDRSYAAIIEEQHMQRIIEQRFPILDDVRAIHSDSVPVTMSIGVGRGARTLYENYIQARRALDMSLGRGGDQASMKTKNGYEFYGGKSRAVEKRNKVKSRIVALALADLMRAAENVVIMGHKLSDLDSLGAAAGIARAAKICGADVRIAIDAKNTMARPLYDKLAEENDGLFIDPAFAHDIVGERTLLIIVDCHTAAMVESPALLKLTENIVIIDHHRKMVGYIENPVLSYHEPYASSCCELVSELLQHIETNDNKPTKTEAEGMLSGIMLDSRDFTMRTGVRTFEAASYLRRLGAMPSRAKEFFATDLATYKCRSELVSRAEIYRGCAMVVSDSLPDDMRIVIPQAADDLLCIDGISASIVAVRYQNKILISARSNGTYNVQLIMENLGGGGHQTMAAVQLEDKDLETVKELIQGAIDTYLENNAPTQGD